MNIRERCEITVTLGHRDLENDDIITIARRLSMEFGGCRLNTGLGFWSETGGNNLDGSPNIDAMSEYCATIVITVMPDNKDTALETIKDVFFNARHFLPCTWIDVTTKSVDAHHFNMITRKGMPIS